MDLSPEVVAAFLQPFLPTRAQMVVHGALTFFVLVLSMLLYGRWVRSQNEQYVSLLQRLMREGLRDSIDAFQHKMMTAMDDRLGALEKSLEESVQDLGQNLEERLREKLPLVWGPSLDSSRDSTCKQIMNSMQECLDLFQGSLQSWMVSEIQSRCDSIISVLAGLQAEMTAIGDTNSQEHVKTVTDGLQGIQKDVLATLDAVKDGKLNDANGFQGNTAGIKQTQALIQSLRSEVLPQLQQLVSNIVPLQQLDRLETGVDQANNIVWDHTNAHKSHDSKLGDLADASERVQQVLLKLQGQLDKIIGRLTPPMPQKAPPPALPTGLAGKDKDDAPASSSTTPAAASTPAPPPPQPEPPVLNLREVLPSRQNLSLFANLPPMQASLPLRWGPPAMQADPRAQEALHYLMQAFGFNPMSMQQ